MIERKRRSLLKVMSWRATATFTTVIISYFITGNTEFAMKIGFIEVFSKILLQYIHERIWGKIPFGLKKQMDYQI